MRIGENIKKKKRIQTHLEYITNVLQVKILTIHLELWKCLEVSACCWKPYRVWNWVGAQRKYLIFITLSLAFHESLVKDYGVLEHTLLRDKRAGLQAYFNNIGMEIMCINKISRNINIIFKLIKYENM